MRTLLTASLIALAAAACTDGEVIDSLDGVDLTYEQDGDMVIPRRADGTPLPLIGFGQRPQTIYLAVDGVTITRGDWREDNAQTNTSFIPGQPTSVIPPFDAGPWGGERAAVIAGIVAGLEADFAGYQVTVTTERPAVGDYTMVVVGGRRADAGLTGTLTGVAPFDAGNFNASDVVFAFTADLAAFGYDVRHVAWMIAHEVGHSLGLEHLEPLDAIMNAVLQHQPLRWLEQDRDRFAAVLLADGALPTPPPPAPRCGSFDAGTTLTAGASAPSCDGRFVLTMQGDGNLVLYQGGTALWASGTFRTPSTRAVLQGDGNLVVYDAANHAHWASGTWGHPGARLAVQDDGNLVVYAPDGRPLWASNTCCR